MQLGNADGTFDAQMSGDFSQTNECGSQLSPGSECRITVTFSPQATGVRNGTLSVLDATGHAARSLVFTGQELPMVPP